MKPFICKSKVMAGNDVCIDLTDEFIPESTTQKKTNNPPESRPFIYSSYEDPVAEEGERILAPSPAAIRNVKFPKESSAPVVNQESDDDDVIEIFSEPEPVTTPSINRASEKDILSYVSAPRLASPPKPASLLKSQLSRVGKKSVSPKFASPPQTKTVVKSQATGAKKTPEKQIVSHVSASKFVSPPPPKSPTVLNSRFTGAGKPPEKSILSHFSVPKFPASTKTVTVVKPRVPGGTKTPENQILSHASAPKVASQTKPFSTVKSKLVGAVKPQKVVSKVSDLTQRYVQVSAKTSNVLQRIAQHTPAPSKKIVEVSHDDDDDVICVPTIDQVVEVQTSPLKTGVVDKISNMIKFHKPNSPSKSPACAISTLQKLPPQDVANLIKKGIKVNTLPSAMFSQKTVDSNAETPGLKWFSVDSQETSPNEQMLQYVQNSVSLTEKGNIVMFPNRQVHNVQANTTLLNSATINNQQIEPISLEHLQTIVNRHQIEDQPLYRQIRASDAINTHQETFQATTQLKTIKFLKPVEPVTMSKKKVTKILNKNQANSNSLADIVETASAVAAISGTSSNAEGEILQMESPGENPVLYLLYPLDKETGTPIIPFQEGQLNKVLALVPSTSELAGPVVSLQPQEEVNSIEEDPIAIPQRMEDIQIEKLGSVKPVDISKILNKGISPPKTRILPGRCTYAKFAELSVFKGFTTRQTRRPSCLNTLRWLVENENKKLSDLMENLTPYESNFVSCGEASDMFLPETIKTEIVIEDDKLEPENLNDEEENIPTLAEVVAQVNEEVTNLQHQRTDRVAKTEEALDLIKRGLALIQSLSGEGPSVPKQVEKNRRTKDGPSVNVPKKGEKSRRTSGGPSVNVPKKGETSRRTSDGQSASVPKKGEKSRKTKDDRPSVSVPKPVKKNRRTSSDEAEVPKKRGRKKTVESKTEKVTVNVSVMQKEVTKTGVRRKKKASAKSDEEEDEFMVVKRVDIIKNTDTVQRGRGRRKR